MKAEIAWTGGDKDRPLQVKRPCICGCDTREGVPGVGYLTGSDSEGNGFTLWIKSERVYQRVAAVLDLPEMEELAPRAGGYKP